MGLRARAVRLRRLLLRRPVHLVLALVLRCCRRLHRRRRFVSASGCRASSEADSKKESCVVRRWSAVEHDGEDADEDEDQDEDQCENR